MTPTERLPDGKVVVYARATGQRLERWPVDARDMLADPETYTAENPAGAPVESPPVPETAPVATLPTEHSPGVPLIVTKSEDAPPAQPVKIPTGRTSRAGKKP